MRFDLGYGTRNMLLNRENGRAAYRQSLDEHEDALHKYEEPGMSPDELMEAVLKGEMEESELPEYWDDDVPRLDLGGSSSWIDGIEYYPSMGVAVMNTNGKQYFYPMTSDEVGQWMNSDSLGSYFNKFIKRS